MDSDSDEEKYYASEDTEDNESRPPSRRSRRRVVHNFTGAPNGKRREAAHVTKESTPLSVLLLFYAEIITLLVVEANRYYHQFLENSDDRHSPEREVTEAEMFAFWL